MFFSFGVYYSIKVVSYRNKISSLAGVNKENDNEWRMKFLKWVSERELLVLESLGELHGATHTLWHSSKDHFTYLLFVAHVIVSVCAKVLKVPWESPASSQDGYARWEHWNRIWIFRKTWFGVFIFLNCVISWQDISTVFLEVLHPSAEIRSFFSFLLPTFFSQNVRWSVEGAT